MGELWRRLWYLLNRSRFERELEEEMDAHRSMTGAAGPRFGNTLRLREQARDEWGWAWLDRLSHDVRFAWRLLWRAPSFTLTAIAILALGIGVNTAMFSAVNAVLIRPLPYPDAGRLVMVWDDLRRPGETKFFSTPPEWREWRRANTVFTDIAASQPVDATLSGSGEPEQLPARKVSANCSS